MLSQELITTVYFMGVAASWLLLVLLMLRAICRVGVKDALRCIIFHDKYETEITIVATFASWLFFFFASYLILKTLCEDCRRRSGERSNDKQIHQSETTKNV